MLSSTLLSCFKLAIAPSSHVLHNLLQCLRAMDGVDIQTATNTLYAVCGLLYLEQDQATLQQCMPLLRDLAALPKVEVVEHAQQLLQAHQVCAAMGVEDLLPPTVMHECKRILQHPASTAKSSLQRQVVGVLRELDIVKAVHEEVAVLMGTSHVDALCTTGNAAQVVVEVDGPTHFFTNQPRMHDGPTLLKHALLCHQGLSVACVHYLDWRACKDQAARRALLNQLLASAVEGL